ncbi:sarcosine oxidase subunit gamma [Roseisalinus antarcticus]|uniref:Sarcosine oxidase, gamma subunit family n=1 Tax=Roseisalinus antarcticus TaxID=254357 RepID=A0A1Y5T468_9RHOB|nr:sarcosine oxidase subunit gamma family protein [Roseisalinus antarcticus]SLN55387.1 Sarcosine oxidase, gamma subunit family [Roseisalinus antarcticus]
MSEVTIRKQAPRGMITLRGDLSVPALGAACAEVNGCDLPARGQAAHAGEAATLWMSSDELLLLLPQADVPDALTRIGAALAGSHHLAVDVSDARTLFSIEGAGLRDVLGKLTPADVSAAAWPPGALRRTRLAQVAAAIWLRTETEAQLICFRSVTDYVEALLHTAAKAGQVGFHRPLR